MKAETIKSIFRGSGTGISSKRVTFFLLLFAFFGEQLGYYFLKTPPNPTLGDQLFTALLANMGLVAAEPAVESIKINAQNKVDNTPATT